MYITGTLLSVVQLPLTVLSILLGLCFSVRPSVAAASQYKYGSS
jgi:hypothetical protein